jgi:ribosomal L31-like protein
MAIASVPTLTVCTATSERTITCEDGSTYPVVAVEISSASHPFYTGAGARPRHGRPGAAVPPPVRRQRHWRLTTSGSLRAPRSRASDSGAGRPVPVSSSPDHAGRHAGLAPDRCLPPPRHRNGRHSRRPPGPRAPGWMPLRGRLSGSWTGERKIPAF